LRWQVLEIFHQVRSSIRNHAQISREQKEVLRLGKKLAACLNGPSDRNLHLVMTAAYFLGGNHFLFLIFKHLGIDDSDDFYPNLSKLKKALTSEESNLTFFDYFHSILSSVETVERTTAIATAIAIRLFSPAKSLQLLISIPHSEPRQIAFNLFQEAYPEHFFNNYLLANQLERLQEQPELLRFITAPLNTIQTEECTALVKFLLTCGPSNITTAIQAIGHLKLDTCRPLLHTLKDDHLEASVALAQLGDESGCRELSTGGNSWRRNRRVAALPGLAFCNSLEALAVLKKRVAKGDRNERRMALIALGRNQHPEALPSLITILEQSSQNDERRLILTLMGRHPNAAIDPKTANLLAQWYDDSSLYPELLEALNVFGYGDKWEKILTKFSPPLSLPHHQKIALFMTRFCERPIIKKKLLELLFDIDWTFSFRLLVLLQPHFTEQDLGTLLNLLQEREEIRKLTIQERLTKGADISNFNDSLCNFFNLNPIQAETALSLFTTDLMDGSLPTNDELKISFQRQPLELKKLFLESSEFSTSLPEAELPLLHIIQLL
ncbi:HEAT repeat domain-containing protein, partial [bacterium]|nr:HEAT repeat domain-containing protein [bacterium]